MVASARGIVDWLQTDAVKWIGIFPVEEMWTVALLASLAAQQ